MDRRIIFVFVFVFTLVSTLLVFFASLAAHQTWLNTILYSLTAMWLVGILSQIVVRHIYMRIINTYEMQTKQKKTHEKKEQQEHKIEGVEAIDDLIMAMPVRGKPDKEKKDEDEEPEELAQEEKEAPPVSSQE
ncbi:hypothetical protein JYU14_03090 [Simkania negevensis]|uniref:Uncharacterized protein n=1 Tax=Simkania negevensis TaxID=83561 RepID=A0ABS3ARP3_9BACT|nr:hypothetical protein [Simkania negevensis]